MTTLLIARHGETDWNREGRFQGHADQPLNDRGRAQAQELGRSLAGEGVSAVYSSDLSRARDTAEIVAVQLSLDVVELTDLREADVGEFTGLTRAEIVERFPERAELAERVGWTFAAGEGHLAVATRVLGALDGIVQRHREETVLVISHGGAIRLVLAHADGVDVETHRDLIAPAENGGFFRVHAADGVLTRVA